MPEQPGSGRVSLTIHLADLERVRLLLTEIIALWEAMAPGPDRDRLEHALDRFLFAEPEPT